VVREIDYTGTMKMQKGKMRAEGVDLDKIQSGGAGENEDHIYWLAPGGDCYMPFGRQDWEDMKAGRIKL